MPRTLLHLIPFRLSCGIPGANCTLTPACPAQERLFRRTLYVRIYESTPPLPQRAPNPAKARHTVPNTAFPAHTQFYETNPPLPRPRAPNPAKARQIQPSPISTKRTHAAALPHCHSIVGASQPTAFALPPHFLQNEATENQEFSQLYCEQ